MNTNTSAVHHNRQVGHKQVDHKRTTHPPAPVKPTHQPAAGDRNDVNLKPEGPVGGGLQSLLNGLTENFVQKPAARAADWLDGEGDKLAKIQSREKTTSQSTGAAAAFEPVVGHDVAREVANLPGNARNFFFDKGEGVVRSAEAVAAGIAHPKETSDALAGGAQQLMVKAGNPVGLLRETVDGLVNGVQDNVAKKGVIGGVESLMGASAFKEPGKAVLGAVKNAARGSVKNAALRTQSHHR